MEFIYLENIGKYWKILENIRKYWKILENVDLSF